MDQPASTPFTSAIAIAAGLALGVLFASPTDAAVIDYDEAVSGELSSPPHDFGTLTAGVHRVRGEVSLDQNMFPPNLMIDYFDFFIPDGMAIVSGSIDITEFMSQNLKFLALSLWVSPPPTTSELAASTQNLIENPSGTTGHFSAEDLPSSSGHHQALVISTGTRLDGDDVGLTGWTLSYTAQFEVQNISAIPLPAPFILLAPCLGLLLLRECEKSLRAGL